MTPEEIARFVGSVGVPAAIAGFVLWRIDGSIREMARALTELTAQVSRMLERLHDRP